MKIKGNKTITWAIGLGTSIFLLFAIDAIIPRPEDVWHSGYSDRYSDSEGYLGEPFWYMLIHINSILFSIWFARRITGFGVTHLVNWMFFIAVLVATMAIQDLFFPKYYTKNIITNLFLWVGMTGYNVIAVCSALLCFPDIRNSWLVRPYLQKIKNLINKGA